MRRSARGAAVAGLLALGGCSSPGELMIAVHTDLGLPGDIDTITIDMMGGRGGFTNAYLRLGEAGASTQLPFTLGFVADEPGATVTVEASAWALGEPRIVRRAVTTIPRERAALLHLPLHFLCDGWARLGSLNESNLDAVEDACGEGATCVAGDCVPAAVDSTALPDYAPEDVFGGRSGLGGSDCFDVVRCFEGATEVVLESDCSFKKQAPAVNVALETSPKSAARGICGDGDDARCFVALDEGSEAGFRQVGDVVWLPPAVCEKKAEGTVLRVVSTPVGDCRQKDQSLPTCGPWSAVGGR